MALARARYHAFLRSVVSLQVHSLTCVFFTLCQNGGLTYGYHTPTPYTTRHTRTHLQCGYRRRVAKRQLRELRAAAREIGTLQRNNEKLKEELAELRCVCLPLFSLVCRAHIRWLSFL